MLARLSESWARPHRLHTRWAIPRAVVEADPLLVQGMMKRYDGTWAVQGLDLRVGPGESYKVAWVFTKATHPVEIIAEFDTWRRIRDSDGAVGWVFHSLLSGKRTAVVTPWAGGDPKPIRADASAAAAVAAYLQPGVMAAMTSRSSSGASFTLRA